MLKAGSAMVVILFRLVLRGPRPDTRKTGAGHRNGLLANLRQPPHARV